MYVLEESDKDLIAHIKYKRFSVPTGCAALRIQLEYKRWKTRPPTSRHHGSPASGRGKATTHTGRNKGAVARLWSQISTCPPRPWRASSLVPLPRPTRSVLDLVWAPYHTTSGEMSLRRSWARFPSLFIRRRGRNWA